MSKRIARTALVLFASLVAGCEKPEIEHYTVPKPAKVTFPWETPPNWTLVPSKKGPLGAEATYEIGPSEITVHRYANDKVGPEMRQILPVVNFWRNKYLDFGPLKDPEELKRFTRSYEMNGKQGTYIDMYGPGSPEKNDKGMLRLLGVMLPADDAVWFFKLVGPEDDVTREKDAFDRFLQSARIK